MTDTAEGLLPQPDAVEQIVDVIFGEERAAKRRAKVKEKDQSKVVTLFWSAAGPIVKARTRDELDKIIAHVATADFAKRFLALIERPAAVEMTRKVKARELAGHGSCCETKDEAHELLEDLRERSVLCDRMLIEHVPRRKKIFVPVKVLAGFVAVTFAMVAAAHEENAPEWLVPGLSWHGRMALAAMLRSDGFKDAEIWAGLETRRDKRLRAMPIDPEASARTAAALGL